MVDLRHHRNQLSALGLTRLEGLIAQDTTERARDAIIEAASRHELYRSGQWVQSDGRFDLDASFRKTLKSLSGSEAVSALLDETLLEFVATLTGEPVRALPPGLQILFTLPSQGPWAVPHDVWHVDAPRLGPLGAPGLQLFVCLDEVVPQGGGTLVVTGSHHLHNSPQVLRSKALKTALGKADYFRHLFDPARDPIRALGDTAGQVKGIEVAVAEMTGKPGDAYLMDLRALHTPAPNTSGKARIMLTCRIPKVAVIPALMNPGKIADPG